MVLHIYSDSSYISEPEAQSRAGGYFFLGTKSNTPISDIILYNVSVHVECSIMRNLMVSATKAELGGLFGNCHKATFMRTALAEMGHKQPPTPVETYNTAANRIVNRTAKQKRYPAIDIIFYWGRDRIQKNHSHILWEDGMKNLADCVTKHNPICHDISMRPRYVKATKKYI